ncbi:MAG: putative N-acetyltransferase YjcF [Chlamydiae bacterium]|nr:putative N-acetyltransferase YjcF [Chlamydiota bacterium]
MITVRELESEEEYQSCLQIRRAVFIEGQMVPEREEIDAFEKEAIHFLAYYKGEPAATGRMRIKKSFIKFERIATLKEFRGRGVATELMHEMQKTALERFPSYLPSMHAQTEAISFYLKLGWVQVGEFFTEAGIDHRVMILSPKIVETLKCLTDAATPQPILDFLLEKKESI